MRTVHLLGHQALATIILVDYLTPARNTAGDELMDALIWIGALLTLVGVALLTWCILIAARARSEGLEDEALKARLQKVVAMNLGALAISAIGLMMVILGIFLG